MSTITVTTADKTVVEQTGSVISASNGSSDAKVNAARGRHDIPRPQSLDGQRKWQLEQMAGAFRVFAKLGFADGSSGHISLRGSYYPLTR
jgi:hypothetical protein